MTENKEEEVFEEEEEEYYDDDETPQQRFLTRCRFANEKAALRIWNESKDQINPNTPDEYSTTPLHACAANGLCNVLVEMLKKPGVNLNIQTDGGNTPLHFAAINGNDKIIKILIDAGADPKIKNSAGQTAYYEAASRFADKPTTDAKEAETVDLLLGPDSEIPASIDTQIEKGDLDGM